jgi:hypothetical protein
MSIKTRIFIKLKNIQCLNFISKVQKVRFILLEKNGTTSTSGC